MARTVSQAWSEGRDIEQSKPVLGTLEGAILKTLRKNSHLFIKSDYVFVFILKTKARLIIGSIVLRGYLKRSIVTALS